MKIRNNHKNIKLLAWFNFFLSFRFYFPILIIYFVKVTGSYALGASVFSIIMLSSALLEIPTGIFSDLIGRKKTLVLGAFATLISVLFYAVGGSYWILAIGAILEGLARAFYSGNNQALLHDTLAESKQEAEYSEVYGKTGSAEQVGLAITAIAGGLIAHWSFAWAMWLSVIPAIVGLFISLKIVEPKTIKSTSGGNVYSHLKEALRGFKINKRLRMLSLSSIIGYGQGEAGFQFRSAFVATLWPIWAIGVAQALSNIGATLSFYFGGKLIKKFSALKILMGGKIYALVSNTIALIYPTVLSPFLMSSNSLFFGAGTTSRSTLMQKEYTKEQRSTMESLNSLGGSIAFALLSFLLGLMADLLSPAKALLILQPLGFVSLIILWKILKKENNFNK
ncbi:MFS transporter [Patescibacteria group bacterium]|nr:MFS transporter [Patescibacteria group bacterium]